VIKVIIVTEKERDRYARQLIIPFIGEQGHEKLKRSHVLVAGVGGLGRLSAKFIPGRTPCLECLYPKQEEVAPVIPVVGPIPGLIAALQVIEALKLIIGFGVPLAGKLLSFDGETMEFSYFDIRRRPGCHICSSRKG